jgi:hypothetical protein
MDDEMRNGVEESNRSQNIKPPCGESKSAYPEHKEAALLIQPNVRSLKA